MDHIYPEYCPSTRLVPLTPAETVDKQRLRHNFGRQAGRYDQHAVVQRRLAQELVATLQALRQPFGHILEIGCGTGYLTWLLRQAFPAARLTALDLAPAALQAAQARLAGAEDIHWLVADGEQEVPGVFDLMVSSSVFQWFGQPAQACRRYFQHLTAGGVLAFATLGPRTFQELASSFASAGQRLPELAIPAIPAQHFVTGPAWCDYLEAAGFQEVHLRQEQWREFHPDLWAFLKAVRGMGATSTRPRFLSRRLLAAMAEEYHRRYQAPQGLPVTYEVLWLQGRKPLAKET